MFYFDTTVGIGLMPVCVSYDFDDSCGLICEIEIKTQGGDEISGYLTEDTNNDIEMECYEDFRKQEKQAKVEDDYDRGQARYEQMMEEA